MTSNVSNTGWRDERTYHINGSIIVWTETRRQISKTDVNPSELEMKAHYPSNGHQMSIEYASGPIQTISTHEFASLYPLTSTTFFLNQSLLTNESAKYFDSIFIKANATFAIGSYLFLKKSEGNGTRVCILKKHCLPKQWIFPWMNQFIQKYQVQEVEIHPQLHVLERIGCVSESECVLITSPCETRKEAWLSIRCFIQGKEIQYLKKHCVGIGESFLDTIYSLLVKWNQVRYANTRKSEFMFVPPDIKAQELDPIWSKYTDIALKREWNKSKTQETLTVDIDALQEIFGDGILQNHKISNRQHFILCVSSLQMTYYVKKPYNNFKVQATITKIPLIKRVRRVRRGTNDQTMSDI
eukprot:490351_1